MAASHEDGEPFARRFADSGRFGEIDKYLDAIWQIASAPPSPVLPQQTSREAQQTRTGSRLDERPSDASRLRLDRMHQDGKRSACSERTDAMDPDEIGRERSSRSTRSYRSLLSGPLRSKPRNRSRHASPGLRPEKRTEFSATDDRTALNRDSHSYRATDTGVVAVRARSGQYRDPLAAALSGLASPTSPVATRSRVRSNHQQKRDTNVMESAVSALQRLAAEEPYHPIQGTAVLQMRGTKPPSTQSLSILDSPQARGARVAALVSPGAAVRRVRGPVSCTLHRLPHSSSSSERSSSSPQLHQSASGSSSWLANSHSRGNASNPKSSSSRRAYLATGTLGLDRRIINARLSATVTPDDSDDASDSPLGHRDDVHGSQERDTRAINRWDGLGMVGGTGTVGIPPTQPTSLARQVTARFENALESGTDIQSTRDEILPGEIGPERVRDEAVAAALDLLGETTRMQQHQQPPPPPRATRAAEFAAAATPDPRPPRQHDSHAEPALTGASADLEDDSEPAESRASSQVCDSVDRFESLSKRSSAQASTGTSECSFQASERESDTMVTMERDDDPSGRSSEQDTADTAALALGNDWSDLLLLARGGTARSGAETGRGLTEEPLHNLGNRRRVSLTATASADIAPTDHGSKGRMLSGAGLGAGVHRTRMAWAEAKATGTTGQAGELSKDYMAGAGRHPPVAAHTTARLDGSHRQSKARLARNRLVRHGAASVLRKAANVRPEPLARAELKRHLRAWQNEASAAAAWGLAGQAAVNVVAAAADRLDSRAASEQDGADADTSAPSLIGAEAVRSQLRRLVSAWESARTGAARRCSVVERLGMVLGVRDALSLQGAPSWLLEGPKPWQSRADDKIPFSAMAEAHDSCRQEATAKTLRSGSHLAPEATQDGVDDDHQRTLSSAQERLTKAVTMLAHEAAASEAEAGAATDLLILVDRREAAKRALRLLADQAQRHAAAASHRAAMRAAGGRHARRTITITTTSRSSSTTRPTAARRSKLPNSQTAGASAAAFAHDRTAQTPGDPTRMNSTGHSKRPAMTPAASSSSAGDPSLSATSPPHVVVDVALGISTAEPSMAHQALVKGSTVPGAKRAGLNGRSKTTASSGTPRVTPMRRSSRQAAAAHGEGPTVTVIDPGSPPVPVQLFSPHPHRTQPAIDVGATAASLSGAGTSNPRRGAASQQYVDSVSAAVQSVLASETDLSPDDQEALAIALASAPATLEPSSTTQHISAATLAAKLAVPPGTMQGLTGEPVTRTTGQPAVTARVTAATLRARDRCLALYRRLTAALATRLAEHELRSGRPLRWRGIHYSRSLQAEVALEEARELAKLRARARRAI